MNIAGYKIQPLRLGIFLVVLLLSLWAVKHFAFPAKKATAPTPSIMLTAFGPKGFESAKPGWTGKYISQFGLKNPKSPTDFLGSNYPASVGSVMHMEVYLLPPEAADPSYSFKAGAYTIMPAVFINPDQKTDISQVTGGISPSSNYFLLLAFPTIEAPTPGQPIAINAMLWGLSFLLQASVPAATHSPTPAPVFVVDGSYEKIEPSQLTAPATQIVPLDIHYQEAGEEVDIQRAEYAAGQELRLLVTVTNLGTTGIPVWQGIGASTASLPGQASVQGQAQGDLASAGNLEAQQSITGYISFAAAVANPNQPVTLRMPPLGQNVGANDLIILKLQPKG
jgi:hypothetical protein